MPRYPVSPNFSELEKRERARLVPDLIGQSGGQPIEQKDSHSETELLAGYGVHQGFEDRWESRRFNPSEMSRKCVQFRFRVPRVDRTRKGPH